MTTIELEAYDAMMASRDMWRDKACELQHELEVADNWVKHHEAHVNDLISENVRLREALGDADDMLARIESEDHGPRADEVTVVRAKIISLSNAQADTRRP